MIKSNIHRTLENWSNPVATSKQTWIDKRCLDMKLWGLAQLTPKNTKEVIRSVPLTTNKMTGSEEERLSSFLKTDKKKW